MLAELKSWYLQGIDFSQAPSSLNELASEFDCTSIDRHTLRRTDKWEPLLRGLRPTLRPGWTALSALADTRRGTATGANSFFLLSRRRVQELRLPAKALVRCVGRAGDVTGFIFLNEDFEALTERGGKTQLLNLAPPLSPSEAEYVSWGESQGLTSRFLLKVRHPWYSMEPGKPAPVWAAVFGRGTLRFILNSAMVRSLTNFHGIFPKVDDPRATRALVFCLNAPMVSAGSATETRNYGGGLKKFEPNDLKSILIPDLSKVSGTTLARLSEKLDELEEVAKAGPVRQSFNIEHDALVVAAGEEAAAADR